MADSRILCRMRAEQAVSARSGHKYQSAGRERTGTCRTVISSAAKRSREISQHRVSPLQWPQSIERNAGSFPRWQSCIGLPSRAKLALRRAAMRIIIILTLVHPMAPQGATRIKKGFPFVCPTGMELGEALRNTDTQISTLFYRLTSPVSLSLPPQIPNLKPQTSSSHLSSIIYRLPSPPPPFNFR